MSNSKGLVYSVDPDGVKDYEFHSFDASNANEGEASDFIFEELDVASETRKKPKNDEALKLERSFAESSEFSISPIVKQYRGIASQEKREKEELIELEVTKRVRAIKEKARKVGFEEGLNQGREEVINQMKDEVNQKIEIFSDMINEVLQTQVEIFDKQKDEIYNLIKNLTKWVIIRELKDDGNYLKRLFEKLTSELGTNSNILVQVNESDFDQMKDVLSVLSEKLESMKNVRVEVDFDVPKNGLNVESSIGIVKGTLDDQFKAIDKLFESVGV